MRHILALALALVSTGALAQAPSPQQIPQYSPTRPASGTSAGVASINGRTGAVTITGSDVTSALTYTPAQSSHAHAESDVTNLTSDLAGKAASVHTHGVSDVTGVPTGSVFYRKTTGTGAAETQTLATLKTDLGLTGTNTGDQTITLTGPVTGSGGGTIGTAIGLGVINLNNLNDISTNMFLGRFSAGAGTPQQVSPTQATSMLDVFTSAAKGLAPASGGGTTNFLRADGTWAAPAGGGTGTVTSVSVTTANGVSGTVANNTTTPAISLTLGAITPSSVTSTGAILSSGTGGVGYTTGAGGTVTQLTSRTTAVTLNKLSGAITLFSKTTTANLVESFTVNNSTVGANDTVEVSQKSGTGVYFVFVTAVTAGTFKVSVFTPAAVGSAEAPVINFNVIKGVAN